jgi:hypothetical protein
MSAGNSPIWRHSVRYSADSACEYCEGIIRHEPWCVEESESVSYAYKILLSPEILTFSDRLILHALGVAWSCCQEEFQAG